MNPEIFDKLLAGLRDCATGDPEVKHWEADALLLEFLKESLPTEQFTLVEEAFMSVERWYA
jgi:hypothetical protein